MEYSIKERLKELRKKHNLTQAEFAEKLNISQSYAAGIERGIKAINTTTLIAIKNTFGISSDWLLFGESNNEPDTNFLFGSVLDSIREINNTNNNIVNTLDQVLFTNVFDNEHEGELCFTNAPFLTEYKEIKAIHKEASDLFNSIVVNALNKLNDNKEVNDNKEELSMKIKSLLSLSTELYSKLHKLINDQFDNELFNIVKTSLDKYYPNGDKYILAKEVNPKL
jgi:transcriptional regulator with XRE-family HTH domain